jgi:hypothetical protein
MGKTKEKKAMRAARGKRKPAGVAGVERQAEEMLRLARGLAERTDKWAEVHNALFGVGGEMSRRFPSEKERLAFSKTPEYQRIWDIIRELRGEGGWLGTLERASMASGNVSLRLPQSLHAALLEEAEQEGVSLNQLCVAKLSVQLREAVCQPLNHGTD